MKNRIFYKLTTLILIIIIFGTSHASDFSSDRRKGFRDVQIRSDRIVTAWLGYRSVPDMNVLKDTSRYTISSNDDADFADGVHPVSIGRFAKGSFSYGWGSPDHMDNLMHCRLPHRLKSGKTYTLTLGKGLIPEEFNTQREFSFDETPNPGFKLNQIGYSERAFAKLIYFSSYLGDAEPVKIPDDASFEIRRKDNDSVVLSGPLVKVSSNDPQGNDTLYKLDISDLKEDGEFYAWIDGFGRSYAFLNGDAAAKEIYHTISKGLYFQRAGIEITPEYGGMWARPMAHAEIYVTEKNIVHPWTEGHGGKVRDPNDPSAGDWYVPEGPREIHGGHYDAGDFDLRLTHVGVGERLMSLYEALPQRFYDGQADIPEAGNGIPDILDEAAWSVQQWEYCQDYAREVRGLDGGVAPGMESYRHPPVVKGTGDKDPLPYWMRKVTPYSSFAGAGLFAQAARVFKSFDRQRSDNYLQRAKDAYTYAVAHKDEEWNPELEWVGAEEAYDQSLLSGAWAWAAGQLYATTLEKKYWDDFSTHYTGDTEYIFWNFDRWIVHWPIISTPHGNAIRNMQDNLREKLMAKANELVEWVDENGQVGYRAACPNEGTWGSASPLHTSNINAVIRAYLLTQKQKYLDAIATSIDFVLGMNPSEISWMSGAGTVHVMDPLNINCKYDGVVEPYPGIVIFGPTENYDDPHNKLYPDKSEMGFYRRIADMWSFVEGCEYVVDQQQAGMLLAAGCLLPENTSDSLDRFRDKESFQLFNNYPNPFHDSTTIPVNVKSASRVQVRIYNMKGQEVKELIDEQLQSKTYHVPWDGTNQMGKPVASGVYICRVFSKKTDKSTKMILLRN